MYMYVCKRDPSADHRALSRTYLWCCAAYAVESCSNSDPAVACVPGVHETKTSGLRVTGNPKRIPNACLAPYTPGGYSPEIWVGVCGTPLKTLSLFQTKICDFPYLVSYLTQNFVPHFRPDPYRPYPILFALTFEIFLN